MLSGNVARESESRRISVECANGVIVYSCKAERLFYCYFECCALRLYGVTHFGLFGENHGRKGNAFFRVSVHNTTTVKLTKI